MNKIYYFMGLGVAVLSFGGQWLAVALVCALIYTLIVRILKSDDLTLVFLAFGMCMLICIIMHFILIRVARDVCATQLKPGNYLWGYFYLLYEGKTGNGGVLNAIMLVLTMAYVIACSSIINAIVMGEIYDCAYTNSYQ